MKTLRNKNEKGFTLIELLVVIAIIGLLASVVLLALNSARAKSRDAKRLADVRQFASALELMFNDASAYPTGVGTAGASNGYVTAAQTLGGGVGGMLQAISTTGTTYNMTPTYIGLIPTAPAPQDGTCTSGQNNYSYQATQTGSTYTLTFCLGASTGGYSSGVRTLTPAGIQ